MPLELDQEIIRRNDANFVLLDDRNITGGLHTVSTVAQRDAILSNLRKAGMLCWVQSVATMYQLQVDLVTWSVFSSGGGGGGSQVFGEIPGGPIDGVNTLFTTSLVFATGTTRVYLNGVRLLRSPTGDYVEGGDNQSIIIAYAPHGTDSLLIDYSLP